MRIRLRRCRSRASGELKPCSTVRRYPTGMLAFFIFAIQFSSWSLQKLLATAARNFSLFAVLAFASKFWINNKVRPLEYFRHQPSIQPIVGASHIEWSVGRLIEADRRKPIGGISETGGVFAADQIGHTVKTCHRHRDVEQCDLDAPAAAKPVTDNQRQQNGVAGDIPVAMSTIGGPVRAEARRESRSVT